MPNVLSQAAGSNSKFAANINPLQPYKTTQLVSAASNEKHISMIEQQHRQQQPQQTLADNTQFRSDPLKEGLEIKTYLNLSTSGRQVGFISATGGTLIDSNQFAGNNRAIDGDNSIIGGSNNSQAIKYGQTRVDNESLPSNLSSNLNSYSSPTGANGVAQPEANNINGNHDLDKSAKGRSARYPANSVIKYESKSQQGIKRPYSGSQDDHSMKAVGLQQQSATILNATKTVLLSNDHIQHNHQHENPLNHHRNNQPYDHHLGPQPQTSGAACSSSAVVAHRSVAMTDQLQQQQQQLHYHHQHQHQHHSLHVQGDDYSSSNMDDIQDDEEESGFDYEPVLSKILIEKKLVSINPN